MSTIGGLLLPSFAPFDLGRTMQQANQIRAGQTTNQTALLQLAELTRLQETEAAQRAFLQQHPEYALGQPPTSTLGSLQATPGPPGAITQTPMPGMPGQAVAVPAYPDASRYAGVSPQGGGPIPPEMASQMTPTVTPPPSTLGSLSGPPQATRNPLMDLARTNPDAAFAVQARMQQQQDRQWKQQEQQLQMRGKVADYLGSVLQGARDQASYDAARQEVARVSPEWAQALPPAYSPEAVQPFIDRALSVKDSLLARLETAKIQALLRGQDVDMLKLQQQGGKLSYQTDAQGHLVAVPEYATGTAGVQSRPVLGADGQPIRSLEGQKLTSDQQKQVRTQEGELRTHVDKLLTDYYSVRDAMGRIEASGADPSAAGDLALITAFMKMLDPTTGVRDIEFKNAATAGGMLEQVKARLGYVQSGERLSDAMRQDLLTRSRKLYEQYEKDYGQVKQQYRDLTTRLGGNPANVVLETGSTAAQPSGGKVLTDADIAATMQASGKTRQQVIDAAKAKGYTVR